MSLKINDNCISCRWCQFYCKNGAIRERDDVFTINPDRCTECVGWYTSPRCVEACFMGALEPDPDYRESHTELLAKWQKLFPNKDPYVA